MNASDASLALLFAVPLALGAWVWGSLHYFPWWVARLRGEKVELNRNQRNHILLGYGTFAFALVAAFLLTE